jgi:integrase
MRDDVDIGRRSVRHLARSRHVTRSTGRQHYSLYPATEHIVAAFKDDIAPYEVNKGTIRFPLLQPVPAKLIGRIAWAAIRKRAKAAGFLTPVGCHTWRATGITIYLENDGRLEHAQQMAGHESPRTTKLYDRTKDEITLSEVERIRL